MLNWCDTTGFDRQVRTMKMKDTKDVAVTVFLVCLFIG